MTFCNAACSAAPYCGHGESSSAVYLRQTTHFVSKCFSTEMTPKYARNRENGDKTKTLS